MKNKIRKSQQNTRSTLIICSVLSVLLISCSGPQKKNPELASQNVKNELAKIEIELTTGANKKAIARLNKIVATHAHTDVADDAYIMLGQVYYKLGQFNDSYKSFIAVINSDFFSPREVDASLGAAKALQKLGRYDEALGLTTRSLKNSNLTVPTKNEIFTIRYELQSQLGDRIDALSSIVFLANNSTDPVLKERFRIKASEYLDSNLSEVELKKVADNSEFGFLRHQAQYRLGVLYFEQRDYSRADSYFNSVINSGEASDQVAYAKNYLKQLDARRRVEPFTIGAVLPLSGRHAAIAQKTLRGLQMGLGITSQNPSDFKLAVIDSEGNPDTARRAVERLVIEDSVVALVGDLISKTAESVAQKADDLDVPVIGLSQKTGLTQIGPNVFQNALTSSALVKDLVASAMDTYQLKRFAIVYPNDPYGVEYANLFWDEVLARGGEITAAQAYNPDEKDFRGVIGRLTGTFYLEDRADEYSELVKKWYSEQKTISSRVLPPTELLPPVVRFDAVFIPDGVKALGQISSMLLFNDVQNIRLLGTNLWNSPSLTQRASKLIENSLFIDSAHAIDQAFPNSPFFKEYRAIYKEDPTLFEAQAYDTGLAIRLAVQAGARSRAALREALQRLPKHKGLLGVLNVTPNREFTRPLTLLTVQAGKIVPVNEPADIKRK